MTPLAMEADIPMPWLRDVSRPVQPRFADGRMQVLEEKSTQRSTAIAHTNTHSNSLIQFGPAQMGGRTENIAHYSFLNHKPLNNKQSDPNVFFIYIYIHRSAIPVYDLTNRYITKWYGR